MAKPSKALTQFIDLARRGKHPGSSSGEKAARKLALAVIEAANVLDGQASEGLLEFIEHAGANAQLFSDAIGA